MKKDAIDYSPKWMGVMYFLAAKCGLESKRLKQSKNFYNT
jgi:hypothetical protein